MTILKKVSLDREGPPAYPARAKRLPRPAGRYL
jgi:hypothetical protein